MSNLGWFFYKDYFKDINYNNLEDTFNGEHIKNKTLDLIDKSVDIKVPLPLGNIHIKATTTYPGLLLGSGYIHELPDIKSQIILGFDFDYTTGLPIIRGSSVKGVLRSVFKHHEYIKEILLSKKIDIEMLEKDIFENQKDIFYDAEIIGAGTRVLDDDYITPHKDALKNPIPLRFVKVASNVTFRLDFYLEDSILDKEQNILVSKEEKLKLFMQILEDLGIGAKTNVGYGKLNNIRLYKTQDEIDNERKQGQKKLFDDLQKSNDIEELKRDIHKLLKQEYKDKIKKRIKDLENEEKINNVLITWDKLKEEKDTKKIKSFYNKKENKELLSQDILEEIKSFLQEIDKNNNLLSYNDLNNKVKLKDLQSLIKGKKYNLTEEEKEKLYTKILNKEIQLDLKKNKFSWVDFKKLFGDDRGQKIGDMLS